MNGLQQAAERLQRNQQGYKECTNGTHIFNCHRFCQWCGTSERDLDVRLLAEAYLAEHPADDDGELAQARKKIEALEKQVDELEEQIYQRNMEGVERREMGP